MTPFLKTCSRCRKQKWDSEFYKNNYANNGLQSKCKDCQQIHDSNRDRDRSRTNPKIQHKSLLKTKYNITPEDYILMLKSQKGVCAICGQPETIKYKNKTRRLAVDHNHSTKKVRDLLCHSCNRLLGAAKENIKILEAAIGYLKKHQ